MKRGAGSFCSRKGWTGDFGLLLCASFFLGLSAFGQTPEMELQINWQGLDELGRFHSEDSLAPGGNRSSSSRREDLEWLQSIADVSTAANAPDPKINDLGQRTQFYINTQLFPTYVVRPNQGPDAFRHALLSSFRHNLEKAQVKYVNQSRSEFQRKIWPELFSLAKAYATKELSTASLTFGLRPDPAADYVCEWPTVAPFLDPQRLTVFRLLFANQGQTPLQSIFLRVVATDFFGQQMPPVYFYRPSLPPNNFSQTNQCLIVPDFTRVVSVQYEIICRDGYSSGALAFPDQVKYLLQQFIASARSQVQQLNPEVAVKILDHFHEQFNSDPTLQSESAAIRAEAQAVVKLREAAVAACQKNSFYRGNWELEDLATSKTYKGILNLHFKGIDETGAVTARLYFRKVDGDKPLVGQLVPNVQKRTYDLFLQATPGEGIKIPRPKNPHSYQFLQPDDTSIYTLSLTKDGTWEGNNSANAKFVFTPTK